MTKTLYVGNLPWSATEPELTAAFEAHASVLSVRIITERETGRSNGFQLRDRALMVSEARPKK